MSVALVWLVNAVLIAIVWSRLAVDLHDSLAAIISWGRTVAVLMLALSGMQVCAAVPVMEYVQAGSAVIACVLLVILIRRVRRSGIQADDAQARRRGRR